MRVRTLLLGFVAVTISLVLVRAAWMVRDEPLRVKGEQTPAQSVAYTIEEAGTILDLAGSGLSGVPLVIFDRADLRELDLSGNELDGALPAEVKQLQELRVLSIANNSFTGLPAEVGQLTKLEVLDLSSNPITGLPHELGNLQNLRFLDLRATQYSEYDLGIIRERLPADVEILTSDIEQEPSEL